MALDFTGERIVPGAQGCEPTFEAKMYQEHIARYAFAAQVTAGKDVLDLGCGVGYGSRHLAIAGARSVLGIDIAEDAIEHAKSHFVHPAVTYQAMDARLMPFQAEFDVIVCFELIEHVAEQGHVLDLMCKALRPGGQLVISTPRPLAEKRNNFHVRELSHQELQGLLAERFEHVSSYFERNCLTSFVSDEFPAAFSKLVPLSDRLSIADADHFLFIAGASRSTVEPILAINDDAYVSQLEMDVANLRQGEDHHLGLIAEREKRLAEQANDLASLQLAVATGERDTLRSQLEAERKQIAAVLEQIRGLLESDRDARSEKDRALSAEVEQLRSSRDLAIRDQQVLIGENQRIRTALAAVSQKLADAESQANALRPDSGLLHQERENARQLREQLARERQHREELQQQLAQSEATLNRFRRSISWNVTRPIRWIGRNSRKLVGKAHP